MKPVFVITTLLMGILVTTSVGVERFGRHRGRLADRNEPLERLNSYGSVCFSIAAYFSLLLVAVLDCKTYYKAHISLLGVFLGSAGVATYWTISEYFMLDRGYNRYHRLRISYVLKFIWVTMELVLVIPFTAFSLLELKIPGAVLEWIISYLYGIYLILLAFDHYSDFTSLEAQVTERKASQRLNQLMVAAFRRRINTTTNPQRSIDDEADCESFEVEMEAKSIEDMNMTVMTRRVSSTKEVY